MHVDQAIIASLKPVGQLGVVQSEQVQNRGMQVVDVDFVFDRIKTEVILRLAIDNARLDATAGKPDGVAVRVMGAKLHALVHRREKSAPPGIVGERLAGASAISTSLTNGIQFATVTNALTKRFFRLSQP